MPDSEKIRQAAIKWIDANANKINCQVGDRVFSALAVLCLTWNTSHYLAEHDPKALKQAGGFERGVVGEVSLGFQGIVPRGA